MSAWRGWGGTGRFPFRVEEGGAWGKHGFPRGSEPKASDAHGTVSRGSRRSGNGFSRSSRTKPMHSRTAASRSAFPFSAVALVASPWTPVAEKDDHQGISFSGPSAQSMKAKSPAG